jgi:homoserine O-acetyltransferase/O-succinyltransferase
MIEGLEERCAGLAWSSEVHVPKEDGLFEISNFVMQCGATLPNARIAYRTHGTLNADKSNAILFPGFLGGVPEALEIWIGEGRPLDPAKFFIILPGQFGIPPSSAPSNTEMPYDGASFPQALIADDVIAQERLIREKFGITQLQLVLGWSVGALQSYEWAVRFPDVVLRLASIAGAPKPSDWTQLWLRTVIEDPLVADPHYANGRYAVGNLLNGGKRIVGHMAALTLPPKVFYRTQIWRRLGFSSAEDFVARMWEAFWLPHDPNDLILQARKARAADPAHGGDIDTALARIKAKVMVAALEGDAMFPPEDGAVDASRVKGAVFHVLQSESGHLATFALSPSDTAAIDGVIAEILGTAV